MTKKQPKTFNDTEIEARLTKYKIEKPRYLAEKTALEVLRSSDDKPAYSAAQIDFLILQKSSKKTVKALITHYEFLIKNGFDAHSIYCMARHDGGSHNLMAVVQLFTKLNNHHLTLAELDKDLTSATIERMVSYDGGSRNLRTLIELLISLKNDNLTLFDLDKDLTLAALTRMVSVGGGSRNLSTVLCCLKSLKNNQLTLADLNIDLTLPKIERIVSRCGGSKRLKTILAYWLEFSGKKSGSFYLTVKQLVTLLTRRSSPKINKIIEKYRLFTDQLFEQTHLFDSILWLKTENPTAFQFLMNNHQTLTTLRYSLGAIIETLRTIEGLASLENVIRGKIQQSEELALDSRDWGNDTEYSRSSETTPIFQINADFWEEYPVDLAATSGFLPLCANQEDKLDDLFFNCEEESTVPSASPVMLSESDERDIEDVTTFFALTANKKRKAAPSALPPSKESAHEEPSLSDINSAISDGSSRQTHLISDL